MRSLIKYTLLLVSCVLLTGCDPNTYKPLPALGKNQVISTALQQWNQKQPIRLQKHQLFPIDYLEKNPHIKGLIINHYLGTGKTFLAIGFAERNPNRPVIILAPGFLHSHWLDQLDKYGVKNKDRYQFFSHAAPEALLKADVSNAIIILDESHRFVERVRSQNLNTVYSRLYFKLRKAHRILALTGTPIYNDIFDLIYQLNLVSGKNLLPFNQEEFRISFSQIHPLNAFLRGHILESLYIPRITTALLPMFLGVYLGQPVIGVSASYLGPFIIPPIARMLLPVNPQTLRDFVPQKLRKELQQYISYYNFDHDTRFYPAQFPNTKEISYNEAQLHFLYRYYDNRLNEIELMHLLKDDPTFNSNTRLEQQENIALNLSLIQDQNKNKPGAGREIGNLCFTPLKAPKFTHDKALSKQPTLFPKKFQHILTTIDQGPGPVVIYSHYYYNGILLFKQFLDASGYKGKYRIFHPDMSKDEHTRIIQEFNTNKIKILLLHPEITEGISLKGTRQLHFLEMPINNATQKQIIGRAIRYRSHIHLPKNEQRVDVYIWKYVLFMMDINAHKVLRNNWHRSFAELNYYSDMGEGRKQTDKNALLKKQSPDTKAEVHLHAVNHQVEVFRQYVKDFAIENSTHRTV
jgi:hypothetical protein